MHTVLLQAYLQLIQHLPELHSPQGDVTRRFIIVDIQAASMEASLRWKANEQILFISVDDSIIPKVYIKYLQLKLLLQCWDNCTTTSYIVTGFNTHKLTGRIFNEERDSMPLEYFFMVQMCMLMNYMFAGMFALWLCVSCHNGLIGSTYIWYCILKTWSSVIIITQLFGGWIIMWLGFL